MSEKVYDIILIILIILLIGSYIGYNWYQSDKLVEQYSQQILRIKP